MDLENGHSTSFILKRSKLMDKDIRISYFQDVFLIQTVSRISRCVYERYLLITKNYNIYYLSYYYENFINFARYSHATLKEAA